MKKKVSLILRLVIALLGVTFIAYSVTWRDHVVFPAHATFPSGVTLEKIGRAHV